MALRIALLCAAASSASAALELTPDNFDELVTKSGKAAFIKFLAPW
jgi:protein disulfide-isomerase A6